MWGGGGGVGGGLMWYVPVHVTRCAVLPGLRIYPYSTDF